MARNLSGAGALFLLGGLLAMGCSHAWDVLEPLPGATGPGGAASTSSGGLGGAGGGDVTMASVTSGGTMSSSSVASSSAASSSTGAPVILTAYYGATLGACNSAQNLDPNDCETQAGVGIMYADALTETNATVYAFVRFDLDTTLVGKTVDKVTLRLVAAGTPQSQSDSSGVIWEVQPFTKDSLAQGLPDSVGPDPIAEGIGAVEPLQECYWQLPTSLVAPGEPVFLAVEQPSENSVDYWNDHGATPPLLIVDYH